MVSNKQNVDFELKEQLHSSPLFTSLPAGLTQKMLAMPLIPPLTE